MKLATLDVLRSDTRAAGEADSPTCLLQHSLLPVTATLQHLGFSLK